MQIRHSLTHFFCGTIIHVKERIPKANLEYNLLCPDWGGMHGDLIMLLPGGSEFLSKIGKNTAKIAAILNFVGWFLMPIILSQVIMVFLGSTTLRLCKNCMYVQKCEKWEKLIFWWWPFCLCELGTVYSNFLNGNNISFEVGILKASLVPSFLCHGCWVHGDP